MAKSYPASEDEMSAFAALVLAVNDFLEQRPHDAVTISPKERGILREGIRYLELAKTGQETVQRFGASIVSKDEHLLAYEEASKALLCSSSLPADPTGKRELFNTSVKVLSALLGRKALNELEPHAVEQTRAFFRMMEDYYFSGQFSPAGRLFDRPFDFEA